ncbi:TolC family protein [Candidatus Sumerlaeota bacterium]|nr:TolC family protein [Candidatus Sumerlaeota bacterium]
METVKSEGYWSATSYLDMVTTPGARVELPATTTLILDLRQCVKLGLENNFDLINKRRDLEIQRSYLREEKAFFIPFVELIAELTTGKERTRSDTGERIESYSDSQEGRIELSQNLPTGGEVSVFGGVMRDYADNASLYTSELGLSLTQPLLRGGGFAVGLANLRTAELNKLSALLTLETNERDTALQIIRQYFRILQSKLDLQVSRDALAEKKRFLREARMKFELDEIPESEVSRAEILYLQEREHYTLRLQSYQDRIEELLIILGLPLDTKLNIVDITKSLISAGLPELAPEDEYIREALVLRPSLRLSDINIQKARINLQVARNALLPFLDFSAETRSYESDPYFRHTRDLDYNTWTAGLKLTIPLPNIARKEAYRRALLELDKLKTSRLALEREIIREVKQAYRSVKTNEQSIQILLKTVKQGYKNLEQEKVRFEFGLNTSVDVRLAQDDLFEAQSRYYTAVLNHQIYLAQLYKAVGRPLF